MTAYIVGGTQAERGRQNFIVLMKMSQLCSTFKENDDDDGNKVRERNGREVLC